MLEVVIVLDLSVADSIIVSIVVVVLDSSDADSITVSEVVVVSQIVVHVIIVVP